MAIAVLLAIGLFICQSQSQLCGPGGVFPGLHGYENGPFGAGLQIGPLPQQIGPSPPGFVPAAPPCRQAPPQIPPCGIQVPPCGIVPPCSLAINNIAPNLIPNQPCGQCSSFIPNQCGCPSFGPTIAPITPVYDKAQAPTVVIDNTLANSLANALQLLIASNLIENTATSSCFNSPVCETANPYYGNIIEVVTPDYPCNHIVACEPIYEPNRFIEIPIYEPNRFIEVPCVQDSYFAPCLEVNSLPTIDNCFNNFGCSDICGFVNPYANGCGCFDNGPINSFANCDCPSSVFSPVVAEVLFPAEIPAQLTCNFGYMSNNVPCVSVNVDPLPFDCNCYNNGVFC